MLRSAATFFGCAAARSALNSAVHKQACVALKVALPNAKAVAAQTAMLNKMIHITVTSLNIPAHSRSLGTMADAEDDELFKVIRMAPADLHLPLGEHFLKLQAQVKAMAGERTEERTAMAKERIAMAEERIAMSRENTAKALTVAAMATEKADMAMEKAAMFKELLNAREQLVFVLYAVGVNNGRSFLAYLVSKWRMEQLGGSKRKRLVVLKEGLKGRPNLVTCLQQNVPGWTRADDMTEEKKVEGLAANLDALVTHIWNNTSDDGHSFDPGLGLILRRTARNGDMVAALACLAKSMAVQCRIEEHTEDEEDATIEKGNDAPSA